MLPDMASGDTAQAIDLSVHLGRLKLKNPTITASGTCGYGDEYAPFMDLGKLGAFTTKSVTLEPRRGNAPQRIVETSAGMLNAIGLANRHHLQATRCQENHRRHRAQRQLPERRRRPGLRNGCQSTG